MKKRIVSFILSVLMLCSLTACGSPTPCLLYTSDAADEL